MKKNLLNMGAVLLLLLAFSCKKNQSDEVAPLSEKVQTDINTLDVVYPQVIPPGSYRVIAGKKGIRGNADGNGANARFTELNGIFVNTDGSLLLADYTNGAIRKLTHDTVVTTLHFPGFDLYGPLDVAATKDGAIGMMQDQVIAIYTPDKKVNVYFPGGHNQFGFIDKDPNNNSFWFTDFTSILAKNSYGADINTQPLSYEVGGFTAISACLNGVKYFTTLSTINKYTKSGVSARIFTNIVFTNLSGIVASKDGYKIYVADAGDIKVISNCPTCTTHTVKTILAGAGARDIALSNSEKYIYFTNNYSVNKLAL